MSSQNRSEVATALFDSVDSLQGWEQHLPQGKIVAVSAIGPGGLLTHPHSLAMIISNALKTTRVIWLMEETGVQNATSVKYYGFFGELATGRNLRELGLQGQASDVIAKLVYGSEMGASRTSDRDAFHLKIGHPVTVKAGGPDDEVYSWHWASDPGHPQFAIIEATVTIKVDITSSPTNCPPNTKPGGHQPR